MHKSAAKRNKQASTQSAKCVAHKSAVKRDKQPSTYRKFKTICNASLVLGASLLRTTSRRRLIFGKSHCTESSSELPEINRSLTKENSAFQTLPSVRNPCTEIQQTGYASIKVTRTQNRWTSQTVSKLIDRNFEQQAWIVQFQYFPASQKVYSIAGNWKALSANSAAKTVTVTDPLDGDVTQKYYTDPRDCEKVNAGQKVVSVNVDQLEYHGRQQIFARTSAIPCDGPGSSGRSQVERQRWWCQQIAHLRENGVQASSSSAETKMEHTCQQYPNLKGLSVVYIDVLWNARCASKQPRAGTTNNSINTVL